MILGGLGNDWLEFFQVLPVPQMIKLLNFHFSASNSVALSGLGIGFKVILKKNGHIPHL